MWLVSLTCSPSAIAASTPKTRPKSARIANAIAIAFVFAQNCSAAYVSATRDDRWFIADDANEARLFAPAAAAAAAAAAAN